MHIVLSGLTSETEYDWIYCYAEDDETNGLGSAANKMTYASASAFKDAIGTLATRDETPPSFTTLKIEDPTAANDRIVVTFELNEAGTAYCRVARMDSAGGDLPISRILTASWSAVYGSGTATIEMTQLENVVPGLTVRDDETAAILEAMQYDVYCWAQDSAQDSYGYDSKNYMTQDYVQTGVSDPADPSGGKTSRVWVQDTTPPVMLFVSGEGISQDTIQLTLQLSEPGTVWCQAAQQDSNAVPGHCVFSDIQDLDDGPLVGCYFETWIKGSSVHLGGNTDPTIFRADVHEAYRNYDIELDSLYHGDLVGHDAMVPETGYHFYCFAEDDWKIEAADATNSANFASPSGPNKVSFTHVTAFATALGLRTTLDEAPPSFTRLKVKDPTAANDRIRAIRINSY